MSTGHRWWRRCGGRQTAAGVEMIGWRGCGHPATYTSSHQREPTTYLLLIPGGR